MKLGTDIGEYGKWFCKYFKVYYVFIFKLCHIKTVDDYVTLHNLNKLLTYIVTLYHIHCFTMELLGFIINIS